MFALKRICSTLMFAAVAALAACGGQAHAAPLEAYNATNGSAVYGLEEMLSFDKDTTSGNRVAAVYVSGTQYIVDDGSWTVYNRLLSAPTLANKFVRVGSTARYINIAKAVNVACVSSQSVVSYSYGTINPSFNIADGCQFWQAVKAVAN